MEIHDCIGYLPLNTDRQIARLYRDNMMAYEHAGKMRCGGLGDSRLHGPGGHFPDHALYAYLAGGIKGGLHTENYRMDDPYTAYIVPAKMMALTIIDLLWDEGAKGKEIIRDFGPH